MIIRRAEDRDVKTVLALRRERTAWLTQIGSDQWSVGLTEESFVDRVRSSIAAGETLVVVDEDDQVVGTIAIDTWANSGLWTDDELSDAVIVHRMITTRAASGRGIGTLMLDQADRIALAQGRRWVRLDTWTSNHALHRYYAQQGFRHMRTVEGLSSKSTALFEREARLLVPSRIHHRCSGSTTGRDYAGNPTPPDHEHELLDVEVRRPRILGDHRTLDVAPGTEWHLRWQDSSWQAVMPGWELSPDYQVNVTAWPSIDLHTEREYCLHHNAIKCAVELTATASRSS